MSTTPTEQMTARRTQVMDDLLRADRPDLAALVAEVARRCARWDGILTP
jgi:hypothetical protein